MRNVNLGIVLSLAVLIAGCGRAHYFTNTTNNAAEVSVTVTPGSAQLTGGETVQFTATVSNATNRAVRWRVTGAGTISDSGLYTAPAVVGSETTAMVTATSIEDTTKSGRATVNFAPVSVHVSPESPSVALAAAQQFTAAVTGSSNTAVTWSLSGEGCAGEDCGSITPTGMYNPPWCVPNPATITVTATSVADPSKSGAAVVTPLNLGPVLSGKYSFLYSGIDSEGYMVQSAGNFTATGGNISDGLTDVVSVAGSMPHQTFSGTYNTNCYARGVMALTDSLHQSHAYAFSLNANGERGHFIELSDAGDRGAGTLAKQQSPSNAIIGGLGSFAFGFSGVNPPVYNSPASRGITPAAPPVLERVGLVGQLALSALGEISGTIDGNYGGVIYANSALTGSYVLDSGSGRGTATITAGAPLDQTFHLSFYPVSATEAFWIGIDSPGAPVNPKDNLPSLSWPLYAGVALRQTGPFDVASLNATSVLHLTGVEAETWNSDVLAGIFTPDGSGNISSGVLDENDDSILNNYPSVTGTYSLDEAGQGRGTLHLDLGGGKTRDMTFYLVDSNKAFLVDGTDIDDGPNAGVGFLEPQTGGPFTNASFTGLYSAGTLSFPTPFAPVSAGILIGFGDGTLVGVGDSADIHGYQSSVTVYGTYNIPESGRGDYVFMKFYMISPTKAIMFEVNDAQHQPTVISVEQ